MPINRLARADERSPTDPQECCDWANARLEAQGDTDRKWVVTHDPASPIKLIRTAK